MNEGNSNTGKVEKQDGTIINWADLMQSISSILQDVKDDTINLKSNINSLLSNFKSSLGENGGIYVDDTDTHTPDSGYVFFAIQALEDSVINSVTGNNNIAGATIPKLGIIYGRWTSVKLTSGSCVIYQKEA